MRLTTRALLPILLLMVASAAAESKIRSLCEIRHPSDARIQWSCLKLKATDSPGGLFGESWRDLLRFNRMDRRHFLGGVSIKVPKRLEEIGNFTPLPANYPQAAREAKFILVDQNEMFLGAYAHGKLVFSFPVALGAKGYRVPNGVFRIDAADRRHKSNLYRVEEIGRPYPMHYGLRFFVDKRVDNWPAYWIHGRDLPGYPVSHGCIGLYDEEMQHEYYDAHDRKVNRPHHRELTKPWLEGAKILYQWVVDPRGDPGGFHEIKNGPRVFIFGRPPL